MELGARYILSVYKNKGFSAAARKLGIAQPSLSATVAKHEAELGFKVFNRGTTPLSLTVEGQIYIDHLIEVLESEKNMRYRIAHNAPTFTSYLRIGVSASYTCQELVIKAVKEFNNIYPHAKIQLNMGFGISRNDLYKKLQRKNFDLIVTEVLNTSQDISAIHLADDFAVFSVRKDIAEKFELLPYALTRNEILSGNYPEEKIIYDTNILNRLPFISAGPEHTTVKKLSDMIGDDFTLSSISVSNHYQVHYQLMREGVGAAITSTNQLLHPFFDSDDIVYFVPKNAASYQKTYVVRIKDKAPHKYEEEFIAILRNVSENPEKFI